MTGRSHAVTWTWMEGILRGAVCVRLLCLCVWCSCSRGLRVSQRPITCNSATIYRLQFLLGGSLVYFMFNWEVLARRGRRRVHLPDAAFFHSMTAWTACSQLWFSSNYSHKIRYLDIVLCWLGSCISIRTWSSNLACQREIVGYWQVGWR